ncbi:YdcF family protein [Paenibacillus cellulositrophicus]|uniref:YdcF family protein n=1 Tax=Paenibacillus cellulositrophicus TaxID=562959 RepID=UPI00203F5DC5|nr:YdcF family protein [Paenibacillus cellulositrophicus]MCM3001522.1 YdcF family protein [Paenibacillus cellulositrophicus]
MMISECNPGQLSHEQINALLYKGISDDGRPGDCIFVFGSNKGAKYRVPAAVQLYKDGRAPMILFSGGTIWKGQPLPEALMMKERAVELGVPAGQILVEQESRHTKENVLASLLVLDRAIPLHGIRRILIVTSAYHMRRAYLTLKTYMPSWIEYSMCAAEDASTREDNWWLTPEGFNRASNEAGKLVRYVQNGIIADDMLDLG